MISPPPAALADADLLRLDEGTRVFGLGMPCERFLFVAAGSVAVTLTGRRGNQIGLYRIGPGQSCVMTTACLLSGEPYAAEGRAETAVLAYARETTRFRARLAASAPFRTLVFDAFAARLAAMMATIEAVAFEPVGQRLATRLLALAGSDRSVPCTHDVLAAELGTAREVVSRQLARWEAAGLVTRRRGTVTLHAPEALRRLANPS